MKVNLFGGTEMVGQSVGRECVLGPGVLEADGRNGDVAILGLSAAFRMTGLRVARPH